MATGYSVINALNKHTKVGIDDAAPKAKFRTKDLSIFKIYANEGNFYPQEDIEQKAGEILAIGMLENLVVKYEPLETTGEYKLISGERRWRALRLLVERGYKEFEFATCNIVAPETSQEEKVALIVANSHRNKGMETLIREERELKKTLEEMKANGIELKGYNLQSGRLRDVIAELLNISKTKVAQIEAVGNNLIPEFMEELNRNRLTFSAAYELSGLTSEEQKGALAILASKGELTYQMIKELKEKKAEEQNGEEYEPVSESDTGKESKECRKYDGYACNIKETMKKHFYKNGCYAGCAGCCAVCADKKECKYTCEAVLSHMAVDGVYSQEEKKEHPDNDNDYEDAHPESITSLCYSCKRYSECNVKTGTCRKCDQYVNKAEAEKSAERIYSEEQDRIDRETAKKIREWTDERKMDVLPSERGDGSSQIHQLKIGASFFKDVCTGKKSFEIRKNDRNYQVGDMLELIEYSDGNSTGRTVKVCITYILEDYTGIKEGYCIMAITRSGL